MDVFEAIYTRRTIARFRPEPLPREELLTVLAAGVWAPNHHLTEPWRFVILGPEARQQLAERYGELRMDKAPADATERRARIREESIRKFLANPAIVALVALQEGDEQRRKEDYAAVCCAAQNIQLAAWARGIGTKWSTAAVTRDPLTYDLLALDPARFNVIGFLYAGYPAETPVRERRLPLDEVIRQTT